MLNISDEIYSYILHQSTKHSFKHADLSQNRTEINTDASISLLLIQYWSPFTNDFYSRFKFSGNLFHHNSIKHPITTIFYACHDSLAVVACVKFCSNNTVTFWKGEKWNFHWIGIVQNHMWSWLQNWDEHWCQIWYQWLSARLQELHC